MVSTTHPAPPTRVVAHLSRESVMPWQKRSLRRPSEHDLRPEWYVQTAASVTIAVVTMMSLVLLASWVRVAIDGGAGVFGIKLQTVVALVCLGVATSLSTNPRFAVRRVSLFGLVAVGLYGIALLVHMFGVHLGLAPIPANTALLFVF